MPHPVGGCRSGRSVRLPVLACTEFFIGTHGSSDPWFFWMGEGLIPGPKGMDPSALGPASEDAVAFRTRLATASSRALDPLSSWIP